MVSSGARLKLVFTTDGSVSRRGFLARLQAVCGGYLTSPRGSLTSPGWPAPQVLSCPSLALL